MTGEASVHHRFYLERRGATRREDLDAQNRLAGVGGNRPLIAGTSPTKALADAQTVCCRMSYPCEIEHRVRILGEGPIRRCHVVFIDLPGPGSDVHDHKLALVGSLSPGMDLAIVELLPALDDFLCGVSAVSHALHSSVSDNFLVELECQ